MVAATSILGVAQQRIDDNTLLGGPYVGTISLWNGQPYYETALLDFGVTRTENGDEASPEKWDLHCTNLDIFTGTTRTDCSLTIQRFQSFSNAIRQYEMSTEDGSIVVNNADWQNGQLDLIINRRWTDVIEQVQVFVDLHYFQGTLMQLRNFHGTSVVRGVNDPVIQREYRVVENSYTLNFPIQMNGIDRQPPSR